MERGRKVADPARAEIQHAAFGGEIMQIVCAQTCDGGVIDVCDEAG